jgi:serine protease Do
MKDGRLPRRTVRRGAIVAAAAVALGLSAFGLHRGWAAEPAARTGAERTISAAALADRTVALGSLEDGFSAIAERLEPSIVSITVDRSVQTASFSPDMPDFRDFFRQFGAPDDTPDTPDTPQGPRPRTFTFPRGQQGAPRTFHARASGSGVVVRSDGWILTNDHVVGGADKVTVKLHDGREFTGTVRRDYRSDLAVVKIPATDLVPVDFADSNNVRVGQWAIAFGSPFELDDTMTVGIISAQQRQKTISEEGQTRYYPSLIQTDAAINPGNSGGALADIHGRLVGINVAINTTTGGSMGIGFAIPSNAARNVVDQLISKGKVTRGYLGVLPVDLTPDQRGVYGTRSGGALVQQVDDGSPAARAGLQVEDVIVRFNGQPVKNEIDLRDMVSRAAPDSRFEAVVRRDGHEQTLTGTVGAAEVLPEEKTVPTADTKPAERVAGKLGVGVSEITPEVAKQFHLSDGTKGVVVTELQPGSPAADARLRPGMVIQRVNGRSVNSASDLTAATQSLKTGETARLVVQFADPDTHRNMRILVTVTMP